MVPGVHIYSVDTCRYEIKAPQTNGGPYLGPLCPKCRNRPWFGSGGIGGNICGLGCVYIYIYMYMCI